MAISKIQLPNDNIIHDIETALTPILAPGSGANSLIQKGVNATYPDVKNEADGQNSITLGDMNQNTGVSAVVGGSDNENYANYAFITGVDNLNNGGAHNSIIAGRWNDNDQKNTLIVGQNNIVNATGQSADYAGGSVIGGHNHVVDGFSTAIFGQNNTNSSNNTLIAGFTNTIGTGADASAALGRNNTIENNCSYAVALGSANKVNNEGASALGRALQTGKKYQVVVGKFNATNTDAAFVVGAGSSTNNRKNTLEAYDSGDVIVRGTLKDKTSRVVAETVKQGATASSSYRPLLLHQSFGDYGADLGTVTGTVHYNKAIAARPDIGEIRANIFTGQLDGTANFSRAVYWGICETADNDPDKKVTVDSSFTLEHNALVYVTFASTNRAIDFNVSLEVNGTGDSFIASYDGEVISGYELTEGTHLFRYDEDNDKWEMIDGYKVYAAKEADWANTADSAEYADEAACAYALFDNSTRTDFQKGSETQPVYFDNGVPVACTHSLNATVPADAKFTDTVFTGGNVSSHIYLTGAKENSSTSSTSQIVFGTSSNNHVALSSNTNALVINPDTSSTTNQIVLYLNQQSIFPGGIRPLGTNAVDLGSGSYKWRSVYATTFYGDLAGTAQSAEMAQCDEEGNEIHTTYQKKMIRTSVQLTQNTDGTYAVNWSDIEGRELYLAIQYVTDAGDSVGFASSIIIVHTQAYDNVDGDPQCYFDGSIFTIDQSATRVMRQPRITRASNSEDICTLSFMSTDHAKEILSNTEVHMYYR